MNNKFNRIIMFFQIDNDWTFPFKNSQEEHIFVDNTQDDFNNLTNEEIVELFIHLKNKKIIEISIFNDLLSNRSNSFVTELFDEYFRFFSEIYIHRKIRSGSDQLKCYEIKANIKHFFDYVINDKKVLIDALKKELINIGNKNIKTCIKEVIENY